MESSPQGSVRTEALRRVAEAMNAALDTEEAIGALLPELEGVLGLRTAWAFRYDRERQRFVEVASTGLPPALEEDDQAPLRHGACECQRRFMAGELGEAVNMVTCSRLASSRGDRQGLVVHASVPLTSKGEALGILNVAAPGQTSFSPEALALLSAVGNHLAVAMDRASLYALEKKRSAYLSSLSSIARDLLGVDDPGRLLDSAVRMGVERLQLEELSVVEKGDSGWSVLTSFPTPGKEEKSPVLASPERSGVRPGTRSVLSKPISSPSGEKVLLLVAESGRRGAFDALDEAVLEAYAAHLGTALENARRHFEKRQAAVLSERARIAAELHDAVNQRLFSAGLSARAAGIRMASQPEAAREALRQAEEQLQEARMELKALVETLQPDRPFDLVGNLHREVEGIRRVATPKITWRLPRTSLAVGSDIQTAFFRVFQEAIHNALRHARASSIRVNLAVRGQTISLSVVDDGTGFDPTGVRGGNGSLSMEERARAIGAKLTLVSRLGHGTRVALRLKLPETGGN